MFVKVLVVVVAMQMAPLLIQAERQSLSKAEIPTTTTPIPRALINYLPCSGHYSEIGYMLPYLAVANFRSSCFMSGKSIIIDDCEINVSNKSLNLFAKEVFIARTKFEGNNQEIRIFSNNIKLLNNEFLGENRTFEAVGVNFFSSLNFYSGDTSTFKVVAPYIKESKNMHSGNYQYHNLTAVDLKQINSEYASYENFFQQTGLILTTADHIRYRKNFSVDRDTCTYSGNNQSHYIHGHDVNEVKSFCNGDHQFHNETGKDIVTVSNWYNGKNITHTINGVVQNNEIF